MTAEIEEIKELDFNWHKSEHLLFENRGRVKVRAKTNLYVVFSSHDHSLLGTIKWFGRWRQYVFYSAPSSIFNKSCLKEIASFCELQSSNHRKANPPTMRTWQQLRRAKRREECARERERERERLQQSENAAGGGQS